jgi:hypothetical protein
MWYKREEQALVVSIWYCMNGMYVSLSVHQSHLPELTTHRQQIVGGLLAYCFSLIPDNDMLHSWQAIFITYGMMLFLMSIV